MSGRAAWEVQRILAAGDEDCEVVAGQLRRRSLGLKSWIVAPSTGAKAPGGHLFTGRGDSMMQRTLTSRHGQRRALLAGAVFGVSLSVALVGCSTSSSNDVADSVASEDNAWAAVEVIDGDTVKLKDSDQSIRIICIDHCRKPISSAETTFGPKFREMADRVANVRGDSINRINAARSEVLTNLTPGSELSPRRLTELANDVFLEATRTRSLWARQVLGFPVGH